MFSASDMCSCSYSLNVIATCYSDMNLSVAKYLYIYIWFCKAPSATSFHTLETMKLDKPDNQTFF